MDYSTQKISDKLLGEIKTTLLNLEWGSVEIFVQDSTVVQITRRQIKKTNNKDPKSHPKISYK